MVIDLGPVGIAMGTGAMLYIADYYNHVIRQLDSFTSQVLTVAGGVQVGYTGVSINPLLFFLLILS